MMGAGSIEGDGEQPPVGTAHLPDGVPASTQLHHSVLREIFGEVMIAAEQPEGADQSGVYLLTERNEVGRGPGDVAM